MQIALTSADNLYILVRVLEWDGFQIKRRDSNPLESRKEQLGKMELVAKRYKLGWAFPTLLFCMVVTPLFAQEQVVEYGRIVQADDGTGSLDYLIGYEGEVVSEQKKPWLPVLSPMMIHLDCWMTRMVNIHQFFSQQAADEYFAMAETCADIPLSMDPNIYQNTGLKYTVLSPIYAWCPGMLNRRGIFGGCGNFGIPNPVPSVAGMNYSGQPMGEVSSSPGMGMDLQPMASVYDTGPAVQMEVGSPSPAPERMTSGSVASNQWSTMSDADILSHFGLDPAIAQRAHQVAEMDGSQLEQPVVDSNNWQFADEAPTITIDRKEVVALNHETFPPSVEPLQLPEPIIIEERVVSQPVLREEIISQEPTIELDFEDSQVESNMEFSSTDSEYDRMKDIEKELLGF